MPANMTNSSDNDVLGDAPGQTSEGDYTNYKISAYVIGAPLALLIVASNILVIAVVIKFPKLRTKTNTILISWAALDLIAGGILLAHVATVHLEWRERDDVMACVVWAGLNIFPVLAGFLHMLVLGLERFWAILYPIQHENLTLKRMALFLGLIWLYAVAVSCIPLLWHETAGHRLCSLFILPRFYHLLIVTCHGIPLTLATAFLYAKTFHFIKMHERQVHVTHTITQEQLICHTKMATAFLWLTLTFVSCWAPFFIADIIWILTKGQETALVVAMYFRLLFNINSAIKILIYYYKYTEIKWGLGKLLGIGGK